MLSNITNTHHQKARLTSTPHKQANAKTGQTKPSKANQVKAHVEPSPRMKAMTDLNDLADGINNKDKISEFSGRRLEAFNQHRIDLYKALIPLIKSGHTGPADIVLFDGNPVTITQTELGVVLTMNEHPIVLNNFTFSTLFEELYQPIYPDSNALLMHHAYAQRGWHGLLYDKNHPSLKELQPGYKSQLYRPVTEVEPRYLNGQVVLSTDPVTEMVLCRHFSAQYIIDILNDESGNGKINWAHYDSHDAIESHIPSNAEANYSKLRSNAKRYDIIDNDQFGSHLAACFEDMQRPEKNENLRVLLIESTSHVMAVRLHIKGTEAEPVYVVSFYDPNITNGTVRCETSDLSSLNSHTLKYYVDGTDDEVVDSHYDLYYKNAAPISMVMECDVTCLTKEADLAQPIAQPVENKLASFACDELTESHLFFLLDHNLSHDLARLQNRLEQLGKKSPEELFMLMVARTDEGLPGLLFAMQRGHAEVIRIYGELFQLLTPDLQLLLLAEPTGDGRSPLWLGLEKGKTDAVAALGKLFTPLSVRERLELLLARNAEGVPAIYVAAQNNHWDTVNVVGELIQQLLPLSGEEVDKLTGFIETRNIDGIAELLLELEKKGLRD